MRKTLFKLHSYFSLVALVPLMIVSLTGSLLVFKTEIDQWLMPHQAALPYRESASVLAPHNQNQLVQTIENTYPEYIIGAWELFSDGQEADRVYLVKKHTDEWYRVYLDPFENRVLSEPKRLGSQFTDWMLNLHYTFLLNDIGGGHSQWGTLLGILAAVVLTFLGISGLIIHRKFWKQLFTLRLDKKARVVLGDIHRLVGAWSAPVILILGITGLYFNGMSYYHEVFEHPEEEHYFPVASLYSEDIDFQALLDDSQQQLEGFTPTYLVFPFEPERNITVFGYQPSANIFASNYSSRISYDKGTGELLHQIDGRTAAGFIQFFDSFRELHFGSFAGLGSKIIWCVFGLAPFILGVSGLSIWCLRHQRKKRSERGSLTLEVNSPQG